MTQKILKNGKPAYFLVAVVVGLILGLSTPMLAAGTQPVSLTVRFIESRTGLPVQNATFVASFCDRGPGAGNPEEFCTRLVGQSFPVINGIATITSSYDYKFSPQNIFFSANVSGKLRANPSGSSEANLPALIITKTTDQSSVTASPDSYTVTGFDSAQPTNPPVTTPPPGGGGGTTPPAGGGGTTPPAGGGTNPGSGGGAGSVPTILPTKPTNAVGDINSFVSKVYSFGISLAGVVFVIMFLIGGLQYLTGSGNEESTGKAKRLMVDAIIGLVLTLGAYAIAKFVGGELGIF